MDTYFIWIINRTNQRYALLGGLSAEQEIELVNIIRRHQENGVQVTRTTFNPNFSLNTQLNISGDITQDFTFVPANEVIEGQNFINI